MSLNVVEYEEIIYEVIKDYLSKNISLEIEELIPFLSARLAKTEIDITQEGIILTVKSLIEKKLIVEGTTLTREEIFTNSKRKEIYDHILENPGVYHYKIMKDLDFSNHLVLWHLSMLLEFDFIKKAKIENHDVLFDINLSFDEVKEKYYLNNEKCKKILDYLVNHNDGNTLNGLSEGLGMHSNTIKKYLRALKNLELIFSKKESNKITYFLDEKRHSKL